MGFLIKKIANLSDLNIDADLVMGAHNITLAAAQTVDGIDVSGHGATAHADRTRKIFIPLANYNTGTEGVGVEPLGYIELDTSGKKVYANFLCPIDYVSSGILKVVWYRTGTGNVLIDTIVTFAADDEVYNTHTDTDSSRTVSVSGIYDIGIDDTGIDFTGLAQEDFIAIKLNRNVNATALFGIIGFIFEYTGDA